MFLSVITGIPWWFGAVGLISQSEFGCLEKGLPPAASGVLYKSVRFSVWQGGGGREGGVFGGWGVIQERQASCLSRDRWLPWHLAASPTDRLFLSSRRYLTPPASMDRFFFAWFRRKLNCRRWLYQWIFVVDWGRSTFHVVPIMRSLLLGFIQPRSVKINGRVKPVMLFVAKIVSG